MVIESCDTQITVSEKDHTLSQTTFIYFRIQIFGITKTLYLDLYINQAKSDFGTF